MRQTFTNKEQEIRTEVQLMPFNARFAEVTTAFGIQAGHQELTAPSPDDPGALFNGLWSPNNNNRIAGYAFNEFKFTEATRADRRPHRACRVARRDAELPGGLLARRRAAGAASAQPVLYANERQHRLVAGPARRHGRQHHGPICRTCTEAGRAVFARRP